MLATKHNLSGKDDVFFKACQLADSLKEFNDELEKQEPLNIYKATLIVPVVVAAKEKYEARDVINKFFIMDGLTYSYPSIDRVESYNNLPNEWMADYHKTIPFSKNNKDQRTIKQILEEFKND